MPDGSWRQQREGEIRNNTNLFLLKSFLRGNRELAKATSRGDAKRINEELERSIHAAVKIQKKRINREIQKDLDRLTEFDEFRTPVFAPCHPSLAKGLRDLPPSLQSEHLLGAISDSLARQEINNDTAELIREMTDEGMTPARAARIHQVSRNAMRQRLRRAAKSINRSLEKRELSDLR